MIYNSFRSKTTVCDGKRIFGGYGYPSNYQDMETTFTNLPIHYRVGFRFTLYFLDTWDSEYRRHFLILCKFYKNHI